MSINHSSWPDSRYIVRHQCEISVVDVSPAKHSYRQGARWDGCIRRLTNATCLTPRGGWSIAYKEYDDRAKTSVTSFPFITAAIEELYNRLEYDWVLLLIRRQNNRQNNLVLIKCITSSKTSYALINNTTCKWCYRLYAVCTQYGPIYRKHHKRVRRNPSGIWVILIFSGQKPCTRIIQTILHSFVHFSRT